VQILPHDPGKRRTEIVYVAWFLLTTPLQLWVMRHLSYTHYNDPLLLTMGLVMGLGTLVLPTLLRSASDISRPLRDLYSVRMGAYLTIWAVVGGFVGTDPWYSVLHGHFAFNTRLNPNGVPLFMLPMTVCVFSVYSVVLGALYRLIARGLNRVSLPLSSDSWWRHGAIALTLAPLVPLAETAIYASKNYCFDPGPGKWMLNLLIYGAWHFSALLFYARFDEAPEARRSLPDTVVCGFATLGILLALMAATTAFIAPHFTKVHRGAEYVNDWSTHNCLGPRP